MLARNISIFYKAFFKEKSIQEQVYTVIQAAIKWFFFVFILKLVKSGYVILVAMVMLSFSIRKGYVYEVLSVFIDPCVIFRVMNICVICN